MKRERTRQIVVAVVSLLYMGTLIGKIFGTVV